MAISKFTPLTAKKDTGRTIGDNEVAKLANLNRMVDQVNAEFASITPGGGGTPPLDVVTVGTLGTAPLTFSYSSQATLSPEAGTQSVQVESFPTITINGGMGFSGTLSSISFPTLTIASITLSGISTLTTVDLPALETGVYQMMGALSFNNNSSLTTLNIPSLINLPLYIGFQWNNNAFSQATVDHILSRMVASNAVNGTINLSGGTSAAPSATGLAAKATLEGRGWTVVTN